MVLSGLAVLANVNGLVWFIFIYKFNCRKYKLALWDNRYTLSQRFQLSENMKTAILMKRVYFFVFISNFITFGVSDCIFLNVYKSTSLVLFRRLFYARRVLKKTSKGSV